MRTHALLQASALAMATLATQAFAGANNPAQTPLFVSRATPPLNMLVMGRDHKLYYEAYNDASDLNGDGIIDVGYKGYLSAAEGGIDYFGYFNSQVCYTYTDGTFVPTALATNKRCSGQWSGDYLNYLTTSRMDALRKVLYGGFRVTDTESKTLLQGAYIPRDAHAWGKEYKATDGYNITDFTPLSQPASGFHHMFAVVSKTQDTGIPQLRVLTNTTFRVWNWVSKERPVAMDECVTSTGGTASCTSGGPSPAGWTLVPAEVLSNVTVTTWKDNVGSPSNRSGMNSLFDNNSGNSARCGSGPAAQIFKDRDGNPFKGNGCTDDNYHTLITATLTPPSTATYTFAVDGDDAVDLQIGSTYVASWYGGHGNDKSDNGLNQHSGSIALTGGQSYQITFRHEEGSGGDNWGLYWKLPNAAASTLTDYNVRVEVCPSGNSALRDSTCKVYGSGAVKPTGILHDFGETNRMHFGLLTGSYEKSMSGGILRANMGSFTREVDPYTGQFCSSDANYCSNPINNPSPERNGIVATINKLRIYDFRYGDNTYGCWITDRTITQDDHCYMWATL